MDYEKMLDEILETNEELRKVFEQHPERREMYIQKIKDSEDEVWGCKSINPAFCQTCAFSHGEPPFADLPDKSYCEIYTRENSSGKPPEVYYEGAECEFYINNS